jgi:hypothetical protein
VLKRFLGSPDRTPAAVLMAPAMASSGLFVLSVVSSYLIVRGEAGGAYGWLLAKMGACFGHFFL